MWWWDFAFKGLLEEQAKNGTYEEYIVLLKGKAKDFVVSDKFRPLTLFSF